MSWIYNFLLETTSDHLGPSPEANGSTWFFQKAPFLASWKIEHIVCSKSFGVSNWHSMTLTFFVQFWLAASQNDRTDCPLKMPYSRDPKVKRHIGILDIGTLGTWPSATWVFCTPNESSWNTDMFSHQDFENWTKIEGVMALTIKISRNSQCRHHLRSDLLLEWDLICWLYWAVKVILIVEAFVEAITPSISVQFTKSYISVSRAFIWCAEHLRGHVLKNVS